MPIHDWSRVDAGIFHAFHQQWIIAISNSLNEGLLPEEFYALPEQHAAGFGPDVLTLERSAEDPEDALSASDRPNSASGSTTLLISRPKFAATSESSTEFYRRKQSSVVIRHVSGDRVVAMIEIVSPGNKSNRNAPRSFVEKVGKLLDQRIHLLILDVLPPGRRDPHGIHAAIWDEVAGHDYEPPTGKPLTLAAYESDLTVRAYVQPIAIGDTLPDAPLFLEPDGCVQVPLETTYATAFAAMPRRWRLVLEAPART
jgi:hypothetical protein